jgi:hypothetical protein
MLNDGLAARVPIRVGHVATLMRHGAAAGLLSFRELRFRRHASHRWHSEHNQEHASGHEFGEQFHSAFSLDRMI